MEINAAMVRNDEETFMVVIVNKEVMESSFTIRQARDIFKKYFPLYPIVLMAQNERYDEVFDGPEAIVKYLSKIDIRKLPWSTYTVKQK